METAAILGAGAWGTALAIILARNGHRTMLGVRRDESLQQLSRTRENSTYLPGVEIPSNVELTASVVRCGRGSIGDRGRDPLAIRAVRDG